MQALVRASSESEDTHLREVPLPSPGPGQVVLKVEAAGVCGTDVEAHLQSLDASSRLAPPVVIGHEGAGLVAAIGAGIDDLDIGDRVVAETTFSVCGKCRFCVRGELNLCPHRRGLGSKANGFFAPFVAVPQGSVHRLPDSIPFDVGAVIEPLACAVHAVVDQARVSGGETIVVFGPGPTGLLIAAVCSTLGAQVLLLGTSHSRPRLELAERFGVARTLSVEADHFSDWISQVLGLGADVVFECSGKLSALETALGLVRPGGRVVVLGEIREPLVLHTQVTLLRKELTLTASKSSVPRSWDRALELLPPLSEMMGAMITHRFPLRRWREAFETVERGDGIKVILTPAGV